jgi:hypothetical protein
MDVFIEKARLAMDYLISIADRLKDGNPWFLHDSLETNEQDRRLFYKRFLHSTAFGKSVSNTLCLNTHIWSLALLIRLARLGAGQRYLQIAEKGIEALRQVLSARPAEWSYKLIYGLRDMLLRLSVLTGRGGLSIKVYTNFMRKVLVPVCKKLFPRILMPNGYIERDLTSVHVSFIYFLVNLKDLLILYRYFPVDWLKAVITQSVFYAHRSGFVRFMARKDPRVRNFEDILLLAVAWLNDARFLSWLSEYMRLSGSKSYPLSADGLAHSAIADWKHTFGSSNPAVEVFTLAGPERPLLLLVNPTEKTQTVKLIPRYGSESVLTDMFNSTSAPVNARKEITLLPTQARLFCLLKESEAEKG